MSTLISAPTRPDARTLAALLLGGVAVSAIGAAVASSLGVWDLEVAGRVQGLAEGSLPAWVWGNLLLASGMALALSGLLALSRFVGGALAHAGGGLALVAATTAVIAFVTQGVAGATAADIWTETGQVAGGYLVIADVQEALLTTFGGFAAIAVVMVALGSLRVGWPSRVYGLAALIVSVAALVLLPLNIPFFALLGTIAFGLGVLVERPAGG